MNRLKLLSLAVAVALCAGFASCDPDPDPDNPANPETDEYGIAISQEVDLGLSVNWAGWNIGATKPEEYGGLYAWGETREKSDYSWETYEHCYGDYDHLIKYCTNGKYGTVDNKTILELQDDVAHVKWGKGWRMPTKAEFEELSKNCTWTWVDEFNGTCGYRVTGKNGNSIFLPATEENYGAYWTSSLIINLGGCNAWFYQFGPNGRCLDGELKYVPNRLYGRSVRAVRD